LNKQLLTTYHDQPSLPNMGQNRL